MEAITKHVQIFNDLTTFGQGCQFRKCSLILGGIPHPLIKQHPFVAKMKQYFLMNFMYPNVNILAFFFFPKNDPICHKYIVPCACQLNLLTLLSRSPPYVMFYQSYVQLMQTRLLLVFLFSSLVFLSFGLKKIYFFVHVFFSLEFLGLLLFIQILFNWPTS